MSQFVDFFRRQSLRQIIFLVAALALLIIITIITLYSFGFLTRQFNRALNVNVANNAEPLKFDTEGFLKLNLIDQNSR